MSTNKKTTDDQKTEALAQYAKQLTDLQGQIVATEKLVIEKGKAALSLAYQAGVILNKVKSLVKHGGWLKWIDDNVEGIGEQTCRRYMALAEKIDEQIEIDTANIETEVAAGEPNRTPMSDLDKCSNLKEAYAALCIVKDGYKEKKTKAIKGEEPMTPEKLQNTDIQAYNEIADITKRGIRLEVVELITEQGEDVNWKLNTWKIENNIPIAGTQTAVSNLFSDALAYLSSQDYKTKLTGKDEFATKFTAIIYEFIRHILINNTKVHNEVVAEMELVETRDMEPEPAPEPVPVVEVKPRGKKKSKLESAAAGYSMTFNGTKAVAVEPPVAHGEVALTE